MGADVFPVRYTYVGPTIANEEMSSRPITPLARNAPTGMTRHRSIAISVRVTLDWQRVRIGATT